MDGEPGGGGQPDPDSAVQVGWAASSAPPRLQGWGVDPPPPAVIPILPGSASPDSGPTQAGTHRQNGDLDAALSKLPGRCSPRESPSPNLDILVSKRETDDGYLPPGGCEDEGKVGHCLSPAGLSPQDTLAERRVHVTKLVPTVLGLEAGMQAPAAGQCVLNLLPGSRLGSSLCVLQGTKGPRGSGSLS